MIRLYLEADDGTQVDLSRGDCVLLDGYFPDTSVDLNSRLSESFDVRINGSQASVRNKIGQINRLFQYANSNQYGPLGVWLYFALSDSDTLWRTRIYKGLVEYDSRLLFYLNKNLLKVGIIIERDPYWEGPEVQIPLSNGNGSSNTTGLNVYNCNDGSGTSPNKKNNYVEIAADVIGGDLPAPVRLEMTNNYNSSARLYTLWLALNHKSSPANFQHIIEGEDVYSGGTITPGSSYSDGNCQKFTWTSDIQVQIARWTLDSTFLDRANKNWFKILAAFTSSSLSGYKLQCKIMFPAGTPLTVVAESQEVSLENFKLQEIGELQIPPWLLSSGNLAPVDLILYARKEGGGTLYIDYLQITPVDGYRVLVPRGYGAAYQVRVVDDGISDEIYTDGWSGGGKTGHYTSIGKPILLEPGKLQRLYFLQKGDTGDISINRVLSLKAYYRPRRVGL